MKTEDLIEEIYRIRYEAYLGQWPKNVEALDRLDARIERYKNALESLQQSLVHLRNDAYLIHQGFSPHARNRSKIIEDINTAAEELE